MRSFRYVSVAVGILCVASQADAGLRRSRMHVAYAPWPPPAAKKADDKKADSAPATKPSTDKAPADKAPAAKPPVDKKAEAILKMYETSPQGTTRRRGSFKRRYVIQTAAPVALVA